MKKLISILLILTMLFSFNGCYSNNNETESEGYILDCSDTSCSFQYDKLNGQKDADNFELKQNDVVNIKVETKVGKISASVKREDAVEALWWGEDIKNGEYKLTADQDGKYTITIVGKNASGSIEFTKEEK